MKDAKQHLESLSEIKNLMERSTKFISLSGLTGVIAGLSALAGAYLAHIKISDQSSRMDNILIFELIGIAAIVLAISVVSGVLLSLRESKKNGQKIWGKHSKILLINLLIPLMSGGILCLILIYHGYYFIVAPATLIFYGLALVNASKYTFHDIRYLGFIQIILGLLNAFFIYQSLYFWVFGFGIMHIIYGIFMHFKYNTKQTV